jgi:hypothetical protein
MANISDVPYGYRMESVSGSVQKTAQNTAFADPFVVRVWDQFGNPWSGTVTFSAPGTNGSWGSSANVTSNASGYATSPVFTASSTTGAFNVTASTNSYPRADANVSGVWETVNPTIVTTLSLIGGGNQKTPPSTLFADPLVVRVSNGLNQPMSGITVTFTAPGSGASCTFTGSSTSVTAVSDGSGRATTVPTPKANATLGNFNVVASATGVSSINIGLTCGLNYLSEVCSLMVAPTQANSITPGTTPWANVNRSYDGNTTGATLQIVSGVQTQRLFVFDLPADTLAPIHDLAKITKFLVQFEFRRSSPGGITGGNITHTGSLQGQGMSGVVDDTYVLQQMTFTAQANVTGAMVKSGDYGMITASLSQSTPTPQLRIRFVKLGICYQNPDLPVDLPGMALHYCEA